MKKYETPPPERAFVNSHSVTGRVLALALTAVMVVGLFLFNTGEDAYAAPANYPPPVGTTAIVPGEFHHQGGGFSWGITGKLSDNSPFGRDTFCTHNQFAGNSSNNLVYYYNGNPGETEASNPLFWNNVLGKEGAEKTGIQMTVEQWRNLRYEILLTRANNWSDGQLMYWRYLTYYMPDRYGFGWAGDMTWSADYDKYFGAVATSDFYGLGPVTDGQTLNLGDEADVVFKYHDGSAWVDITTAATAGTFNSDGGTDIATRVGPFKVEWKPGSNAALAQLNSGIDRNTPPTFSLGTTSPGDAGRVRFYKTTTATTPTVQVSLGEEFYIEYNVTDKNLAAAYNAPDGTKTINVPIRATPKGSIIGKIIADEFFLTTTSQNQVNVLTENRNPVYVVNLKFKSTKDPGLPEEPVGDIIYERPEVDKVVAEDNHFDNTGDYVDILPVKVGTDVIHQMTVTSNDPKGTILTFQNRDYDLYPSVLDLRKPGDPPVPSAPATTALVHDADELKLAISQNKDIKLMKNIQLSSGWNPAASPAEQAGGYTGIFDGNNYRLIGTTGMTHPVFSKTNNAVFYRVQFTDFSMTRNDGTVGYGYTSDMTVGTLVDCFGGSAGEMLDCFVQGSLTVSTTNTNSAIGGVAGEAAGKSIYGVKAQVNLTQTTGQGGDVNGTYPGGLFGVTRTNSLENCELMAGSRLITNADWNGGLVSVLNANLDNPGPVTVRNCKVDYYFKGNSDRANASFGGLIQRADSGYTSEIDRCIVNVNYDPDNSAWARFGGVLAQLYTLNINATISNCDVRFYSIPLATPEDPAGEALVKIKTVNSDTGGGGGIVDFIPGGSSVPEGIILAVENCSTHVPMQITGNSGAAGIIHFGRNNAVPLSNVGIRVSNSIATGDISVKSGVTGSNLEIGGIAIVKIADDTKIYPVTIDHSIAAMDIDAGGTAVRIGGIFASLAVNPSANTAAINHNLFAGAITDAGSASVRQIYNTGAVVTAANNYTLHEQPGTGPIPLSEMGVSPLQNTENDGITKSGEELSEQGEGFADEKSTAPEDDGTDASGLEVPAFAGMTAGGEGDDIGGDVDSPPPIKSAGDGSANDGQADIEIPAFAGMTGVAAGMTDVAGMTGDESDDSGVLSASALETLGGTEDESDGVISALADFGDATGPDGQTTAAPRLSSGLTTATTFYENTLGLGITNTLNPNWGKTLEPGSAEYWLLEEHGSGVTTPYIPRLTTLYRWPVQRIYVNDYYNEKNTQEFVERLFVWEDHGSGYQFYPIWESNRVEVGAGNTTGFANIDMRLTNIGNANNTNTDHPDKNKFVFYYFKPADDLYYDDPTHDPKNDGANKPGAWQNQVKITPRDNYLVDDGGGNYHYDWPGDDDDDWVLAEEAPVNVKLNIVKMTNISGNPSPLDGATFTLYRAPGDVIYSTFPDVTGYTSDSAWTTAGWTVAGTAQPSGFTGANFVNGGNDVLITPGSYVVKETAAPVYYDQAANTNRTWYLVFSGGELRMYLDDPTLDAAYNNDTNDPKVTESTRLDLSQDEAAVTQTTYKTITYSATIGNERDTNVLARIRVVKYNEDGTQEITGQDVPIDSAHPEYGTRFTGAVYGIWKYEEDTFVVNDSVTPGFGGGDGVNDKFIYGNTLICGPTGGHPMADVNFSDVEPGYYELTEIKAPDGYAIDPTPFTFKVENQNGTAVVTFVKDGHSDTDQVGYLAGKQNLLAEAIVDTDTDGVPLLTIKTKDKKPEYGLTLKKYDGDTQAALADVSFEVYDNAGGGLLGTYITTAPDGLVTIPLPPENGSYTIKEALPASLADTYSPAADYMIEARDGSLYVKGGPHNYDFKLVHGERDSDTYVILQPEHAAIPVYSGQGGYPKDLTVNQNGSIGLVSAQFGVPNYEGTSVSIQGEKIVRGMGAPTSAAFTFTLTQVTDATGNTAVAPSASKVKLPGSTVSGAGTFQFAPIYGLTSQEPTTITEPAPKDVPYNLYFKVQEVNGGAPGWTYDTAAYVVTVTVSRDGTNGPLQAIASYPSGGRVTFTNSYTYSEIISVEVDKDTIRRTAAAYVSAYDPGNYTNVGETQEMYRYDLDFRSTSNIVSDEFVVDDPLEAISTDPAADQVRLDGLWTPAVWGDADGKMNIWYKTSTGGGDDDPAYKATIGAGTAAGVTPKAAKLFPTNAADGWKLWKHIDAHNTAEYTARGVIPGYQLTLPPGVSGGEANDPNAATYITEIRFEYGAVKVGFTSRNYSKESSLNKDYRDSNGVVDSDNFDKIVTIESQRPAGSTGGVLAQSVKVTPPQANSISDLSLRIATQGAPVPLAAAIVPLGAVQKGLPDWTPQAVVADIPPQLAALPATRETSPLRPATYLVRTTRAMSNEDIVSSVSAHIASGLTYDEDQDRVLTREIGTFSLDPAPPEIGSIVAQDSFVNHANESGIVLRGGHWVDRDGNRIRVGRGGSAGTGDVMALGLWFAIMVITLICLILLRMTYGTGRRRKWIPGQTRDDIAYAGGDMGYAGGDVDSAPAAQNDSVFRGNDGGDVR